MVSIRLLRVRLFSIMGGFFASLLPDDLRDRLKTLRPGRVNPREFAEAEDWRLKIRIGPTRVWRRRYSTSRAVLWEANSWIER